MRIAALLLAAVATPTFADDFRSATFGMTPDEVRATESGVEWRGQGDLIGFNTEIADLDVLAQFQFRNGKLYSGGYRVREQHSNRTLYVDDYGTLLELLTEKYGKPKDDVTLWRNDLYRNDPEDYGTAVAIGHLVKGAKWETPTAEIEVMLSGDNYDINLVVFYISRQLQESVEADKRQEALNDL